MKQTLKLLLLSMLTFGYTQASAVHALGVTTPKGIEAGDVWMILASSLGLTLAGAVYLLVKFKQNHS
jgi:hypothetical protein